MFERDPKTGALAPMHHPFTSAQPDDHGHLATSRGGRGPGRTTWC
jgi:aspartyl-tRNA synthetase